jgi:hypothetical protein
MVLIYGRHNYLFPLFNLPGKQVFLLSSIKNKLNSEFLTLKQQRILDIHRQMVDHDLNNQEWWNGLLKAD